MRSEKPYKHNYTYLLISIMAKRKTYIILLILALLSKTVYGQERITLSPNAPLCNSITLLKTLSKEIPADSLVAWIRQGGTQVVLCQVDSCGRFLDFVRFSVSKKTPEFIIENRETIKQILMNHKPQFVLPCEFTCITDKDKEIELQKQCIAESYEEKGFIHLGIPIFYVFFPSMLRDIENEEAISCKRLSAEEYLEKLYTKYTPEYY